MLNKVVVIILSLLLLVSCQKDQSVSFVVVQLNDVYEIGPVEGGKYGGLARVATVINDLKKENPNVLTVLSGDFLSPSLIGMLKQDGKRISGAQMIEVLNAMGLDVATFGNHEFDIKEEELEKRLLESDFHWVSANVQHLVNGATEPFKYNIHDNVVGTANRMTYTYKNDHGVEVKVGITGVTLPFNKAPYVHYNDYTTSLQNQFEKLNEETDVQIALTHLNIEQDKKLANDVPGFELFLGGHDHDNMIHFVGNTSITKADANAKSIYVHRIIYDKQRKITTISTKLMPITDSIPADPKTDAVVQKWLKFADELLMAEGYNPHEVIYHTDTVLDGRESSIRNEPTAYGKLVATALKWAYADADVALFNSGSLRVDDQLTGDLTQTDILRSFPFGGKVVTVEMTGKDLVNLLEVGTTTNKGSGGYLQTRDVEKTENRWYLESEPINDTRKYTVVMPEFLAGGHEKNLAFIGQYTPYAPDILMEGAVNNDIRAVIIAYLKQL